MSNSDQIRRMKKRIADGGFLTGMAAQVPTPEIIEILSVTGHDFVIVDIEHSAAGANETEAMIRAADANGLPSLVKLKSVDEVEIRNALDAGASGVMAPHIRTPEDLRTLIDYCRFPPKGHRGLCSAARANRYSSRDIRDLVRFTNEELLVIPVIEDKEAVDNLDAIIGLDPSVEIFDIGPVDLALSMGLDLDRSITNPSPELTAVLDEVLGKLSAAGKSILYPTRFPNSDADPIELRKWMQSKGINMVYGMDTHALVAGSRALGKMSAGGES
jgi:2-keto-3-deoxy-L-rhamnonate aldolase RhmA